jgi:outer membrane protein assembly factor BamA
MPIFARSCPCWLVSVGLSSLLILHASPAVGAKKKKRWKPEDKKIRSIYLDQRDIFDETVRSENKPLYRLVNKLHISTKERVIRDELLFQEGDPYDRDLAKESERNLRRGLRLRKVKIKTIPVDERTLDLNVETHETWTTEPTISLQGVGGELSGKIGLRERNFLGYGKQVTYFYRQNEGVISRTFAYDDRNVLGTRLRFDSDYQDSEDGLIKSASLARPFYSSVTQWSASVAGLDQDMETRIYEAGRETSRFRNQAQDFKVNAGLSLGSTPLDIRRAGLGYRFLDQTVSQASPVQARILDKTYHVFQTGLYLENVNFLTVDHINLYDREEDFNLGPVFSVTPGFSRNRWVRGAENANFVEWDTVVGKRMGPSRFALWTFKGKGRFEENNWRDTRPRLDYRYYDHYSPRQTAAVHFQAETILRPAPGAQLVLGGNTGLRGYPLNQLTGNKLLLANLEHRLFLIPDILKLLGLGTAAFVDVGGVWEEGKKVDLRNTRMNVGGGLRFHISRSSLGHVLRLDVAYAIKNIEGVDRTVITFGSDQAF